ncbi:cupin domain-containing protein [Enterococcus asini]|uniref:cupin domain-containing protein n=1 Tax=Enterococcus asini TaxID=57732 RepID=UPI000E48AB9C|nr:cupin domain-containing protein [Enterococcus asini]RGW12367.1 cupin domain-containing protein [Enterococcus asini]
MVIYKNEVQFKRIDSNTQRAVLTYSEQVMSVLVKFDDVTETVKLHHHPEEQVTYVLSGRFKFFIGEEEYEVGQGDVLRFEPNQPHGCIVLEPGSELLDTFTPYRKDFL